MSTIKVPRSALLCRDMNYENRQHLKELCSFYEDYFKQALTYKQRTKACNSKPGWKDHVEELHADTRPKMG